MTTFQVPRLTLAFDFKMFQLLPHVFPVRGVMLILKDSSCHTSTYLGSVPLLSLSRFSQQITNVNTLTLVF